MDNQHKKITGYRDLSETEIANMNRVKAKAEEVSQLIEELNSLVHGDGDHARPDGRWLAIARTELQQGFMALVRAIAKPTTF